MRVLESKPNESLVVCDNCYAAIAYEDSEIESICSFFLTRKVIKCPICGNEVIIRYVEN